MGTHGNNLYLLINNEDIIVNIPTIDVENKENITSLQKIFITVAKMIKAYDPDFMKLVNEKWESFTDEDLMSFDIQKCNYKEPTR